MHEGSARESVVVEVDGSEDGSVGEGLVDAAWCFLQEVDVARSDLILEASQEALFRAVELRGICVRRGRRQSEVVFLFSGSTAIIVYVPSVC